MTIDEAAALLAVCYRHELVDHAFGDAEVSWSRSATEIEPMVATGYFGNSGDEVEVMSDTGTKNHVFRDDVAAQLRCVGLRGLRERNDGR